jgi:hypothetical protein
MCFTREEGVVKMPDVVFGDGNLAEAAALFDQLPTSKPAGYERRVSIEVQPTPERRGLFRRPVPVPTASVSAVFPDSVRPPSLLLQVSNFGLQTSDAVDPLGYGDALARHLSARGVDTPDGWSLFWAFNSGVHWEIPFDEDPHRVIDHTITVLEAISETPPQTFEAKVERRGRYDGRTSTASYME